MLLGILSDTHNDLIRARNAVEILKSEGADSLAHCGDLASPDVLEICCVLPCYFIFGNHDADTVPDLRAAAGRLGARCLGWAGEFLADGKRVAMAHGHMQSDLNDVLAANPDYLLCGHSHMAQDRMMGSTRRINPGALFRADKYSVAILDPGKDELRFISVP